VAEEGKVMGTIRESLGGKGFIYKVMLRRKDTLKFIKTLERSDKGAFTQYSTCTECTAGTLQLNKRKL